MSNPGKTGAEAINALYPYLQAERDGDGGGALRDALLQSARDKSAASARVQQQFFAAAQGEALLLAAQALAAVYRRDGRLLCMGNGGSACDAAHVSVEFNHPVTAGRKALPAVNLTADVPMLTAVSNDVGYAEVFSRQVLSLGREGDALLGVSTSGGSKNLLQAFACGRDLGMITFALLGGDGGEIAGSGLVDHCLVVDSDSVHRIQETHVIAYHVLWDLVHSLLGGGS